MIDMAKKPSATVGYAMPTSKVKTVVQPSLVAYAKERGISLIEVDIDKPIIEQGPFDVLVHKVYGDEWNAQLRDFKVKYPDVVVFDPPEAIECIHNRESMLEAVNQLRVPPCTSDEGSFSIGTPTQIVINVGDNTQENLSNIQEKLTFPIIAKPLLANSNDKAHEMWVIFTPHGLKKVQPPVILQQFVNHGGILFKVYVAGDHVKCVKRNSLPDFHFNPENPERLGSTTGNDIMSFSQISSSVVEDEDKFLKDAKMPSLDMVYTIAKGLKEGSKLNLFNFDLIRDGNDGNKYLIIDINYFPGYAKVPGFEKLLTDFFWDVINQKNKDGVGHLQRKNDCLTVMYNYVTCQFYRFINRT